MVGSLKNCPFCGGEAEMCTDPEGRYYVECTYCHSRSNLWQERPVAAMFWNSRKIPEDLIMERWKHAEDLLLQALSNAGFVVTESEEYVPPPAEWMRKLCWKN